MICSACWFINPDFAKFCGRCGVELANSWRTPPPPPPVPPGDRTGGRSSIKQHPQAEGTPTYSARSNVLPHPSAPSDMRLVEIREELDKLTAELADPLRDMLQNASVVDTYGKEVKVTDLRAYAEMDIIYLLKLFSSLEGRISSNRAKVVELFLDKDHANADEERVQLIRTKFADMFCKDQQPIRQLATLELLAQYDELSGTEHTKQAEIIFGRLADFIGQPEDGLNSKLAAALNQLQSLLRKKSESAKST